MKFKFGRQPKRTKPKKKRKPLFAKAKKKGSMPKNVKVFRKEKKTVKKTKGPARYRYSIVQSKENRIGTFATREQAIIRMNKLKESQPGAKYRMVVEKQPKGWL